MTEHFAAKHPSAASPLPSARRKTRASVAFALLCGLSALALLPGCTTGRNNAVGGSGGGGGASSSSVAVNENTLRYALISEPTTLDPALVEDGTTIDLLQNIFSGLVKWDEQNHLVPDIAEKWDLSADGKTYTFHLRSDVKFHNGRLVTADDFKYSLERVCDPALNSPTAANYLKDIVGASDRISKKAGVTSVDGIKVVDPHTLQITLNGFTPYWLGNMTYPVGYVVCKEAVEKNNGKLDENACIGTGPFKLAEFRRGAQVTLAANPDFYGGKPRLDFISRPILKDNHTRLDNYEAGQLDIVDLSPRDLDRIQNDPKLSGEMKSFPRAAIWYVALNAAAPNSPFTKKEVRQAFAMAIDKNEIVSLGMKGQADVANGIIPPGVPDYNSTAKTLPYDPAKAKLLLAQAGYADGKNFPALLITFRNDQKQVEDSAQVIARQLKTNLNVDVQMRPMEWGQFLTERLNKSMPLSHLRWAADYLDPQNFLSLLLHTSKRVNGQEDHPENGVGYSNPEFDRLCDQADSEHDPQKRMALYRQAEQIAIDDAPWVPIYFQKDVELIKPRVGHLRDSLFGHLPHVTTTVQ